MGQADSQFKAFIRFVIDALREINAETDEAKRAAKMEKDSKTLSLRTSALAWCGDRRECPWCNPYDEW